LQQLQILHFEIVPPILLQFYAFGLQTAWSVLFSHKEFFQRTMDVIEIRVLELISYKFVVYLTTLSGTQSV
jgi:hypothetical protein